MPTFRRLIAVCLIALLSTSGFAATATDLIPATAPRGARVIVRGTDLDRGDLGVTFPDAATGSAATVHERASKYAEVSVPASAVSGNVRVTQGATQLASLPFTLAPDDVFSSVATLAASDQAHDLLKSPGGIALDPATGTIYVADTKHHQIKTISPQGVLGVLAGSGQPGLTNGTGSAARFNEPAGLAFDAARQMLYVADSSNHAIRRVTLAGAVTTLAGSGRPGDRDGQGVTAELKQPMGVAVDAAGVLFVADTANSRVKRITSDGGVTTIAGSGGSGFADGGALDARFAEPEGIAVDASGAVLIADTGNNRIRRIAAGVVMTVAGSGAPGFADAAPSGARFDQPRGLALDEAGNLFVADSGNDVVRKLGSEGVTTVAGRPSSNSGHNDIVDGSALQAQFDEPLAIAVNGALFVADAGHDAVRIVLPEVKVSDVYPARGPLVGGNVVRVFGSGFVTGRTTVTVGGAITPSVLVSSTEMLITMPAHSAGAVDIVVTTPAGSTNLAVKYTYVAPPTLTSISPTKGKTAGGQFTTLRGTEFAVGDTEVLFGGVPATAVIIDNPTSATVTTPPVAEGSVDIIARTDVGEARLDAAYQYFDPPVIGSITPLQARVGELVTISGENFDPELAGNSVSIGGVLVPIVSGSQSQLVVSLPMGVVTGTVNLTTVGGTAVSAAPFVVLTYTSIVVAPVTASINVGEDVTMNASGVLPNGTTESLSNNVTWSTSDSLVATVSASGSVQGLTPGTASITATYRELSASSSIVVKATIPLPPDPATVAPPADPTVVGSFSEGIRFLYSGSNPIQTGVNVDAIDQIRASVVRGVTQDTTGIAVGGVRVSIKDHPEFGSTLTRADGVFDLVANGGDTVLLEYSKNGYLPVHRRVNIPWADYIWADSVVMTPVDSVVTTIALGTNELQVARSSSITDHNGARRALVVFGAGTSAQMTLPDGSSVPVPQLHVRATEYSVGTRGPLAMPAPLPLASGYTYCVELSADEAIAAGATSVIFSQPVWLYVDNFLDFPIGGSVPIGYYDRTQGKWIASSNGRIIKIVGITGTLADIDVDGDGIADTPQALSLLGITPEEQSLLAQEYTPGKSLWRSPVPHFTPWDCNWPYVPPSDAVRPTVPEGSASNSADNPNCERGSIIECQNMILRESVALTGALSMSYRSDRAQGYLVGNTVAIPVTDKVKIPASLRRAHVRISIAGQRHELAFAPQIGIVTDFTWDGKNAYGERLRGPQNARIEIGYVYPLIYAEPAAFAAAFAAFGDIPISGGRGTSEVTLWQSYEVRLGLAAPDPLALHGWSLPMHHAYDPLTSTLHNGNGARQRVKPLGATIDHYAGRGSKTTNGTPAREFKFIDPGEIKAASDGSLYVLDRGASKVYRISRDGMVFTVAGTGDPGNGTEPASGIATQVKLYSPKDLVVASSGTLYIAEPYRIRRISGGFMTTVAGTGRPPSGTVEGKSALEANITPEQMALDPLSGELYFNNGYGSPIYRIDSQHLLRLAANFPYVIYDMAFSPTGDLYFVGAGQNYANQVFQLKPESASTRVFAGTCVCFGAPTGSGTDAGQSGFGQLTGIDFDNAGRMYLNSTWITDGFSIQAGAGLSYISADRKRYWIAGRTKTDVSGDGGLALAAGLGFPRSLAVGPNGDLYFIQQYGTTSSSYGIRRVVRATGVAIGDTLVPEGDGSAVFRFDSNGRHQDTRDAYTGRTLWAFEYDDQGRLLKATDAEGDTITIVRAGSSVTVESSGSTTTLHLNGDGDVANVELPGSLSQSFTYQNGLLKSYGRPSGTGTTFSYDSVGRLIGEADAAHASKTLVRSGTAQAYTVESTTPMGRRTRYSVDQPATGREVRTTIDPSGLQTRTTSETTGRTDMAMPDGTTITATRAPDARWGMGAAFNALSSATTPSGLRLEMSSSRTPTLSNSQDPFSVSQEIRVFIQNGRTWTSTWTASSRSIRSTSPLGRSSSTYFDVDGRVREVAAPRILPVTAAYDSRGRMTTLTQGDRLQTTTWNLLDQVTGITDALGRVTTFKYDDSGRVTTETLPDGRRVAYSYDDNGNVTGVTPPTRPIHLFVYNDLDLATTYDAPDVATSVGAVRYEYNADYQLTRIIQPDDRAIVLGYDAGGRSASISGPDRSRGFTYNAAGQLASAIDSHGASLQYSWDGALIRQMTWSGGIAGSVSWTYNNDFRRTGQTIGGTTIGFSYDADGLLATSGALILRRDVESGFLTGTSIGNVSDAWTYNSFGEPATYAATFGSTNLLTVEYTRDVAGRIINLDETSLVGAKSLTYDYDRAGKLVMVRSGTVPIVTYDYDPAGNRTKRSYLGGYDTATHDEQDRLLTYGGRSYTYGANGELKTSTLGGQTTTFEHDSLGNLQRVIASGRVLEYVSDAQNRRVGKKIDGILLQAWLYDNQLNIVAELDGTGAIVSRFVYGSRTNVPDYMIKSGITYRIVSDHIGSPRLVVNIANGAVSQALTYDEFGNVLSDTSPGFQPFGFAGGLYDRDTGLVRMGARDYDPHTGRFVTKDPIGFAGGDTNVYAYSLQDPVNLIDPSGLLFGGTVNVGESYGQAAMQQYAGILTDPDAAWYEKAGAAAGGFFSALWTPCTSDATFTTLTAAYTANAYVGRSFWQYYPSTNPAYNSRWMTRGSGWGSPYTLGDEAVGKLALPRYNPATRVREVPNSWRYYTAGPRPVRPDNGRLGGGTEYYKGWRFP